MQYKVKHGKSAPESHPIVTVHQVHSASVTQNKGMQLQNDFNQSSYNLLTFPCVTCINFVFFLQETGYYVDNLAFSCEDESLLTTRNANDVYSQLSQPLDGNGMKISFQVYLNLNYLIIPKISLP